MENSLGEIKEKRLTSFSTLSSKKVVEFRKEELGKGRFKCTGISIEET